MLHVVADPRPAATRRRDLTLPAGFIPPCLPMMAARPPSGSLWLHEIKHDGFRVIAQKDGEQVRLYGLRGDDLTQQFPLVAEAVARLPSSCTIDGEAVVCDGGAAASSGPQRDGDVFLHVFDLIELEGGDRRRDPLLQRKIDLIRLLADAAPGLALDGWIDGRETDAATLFGRACSLGLKGIVSKRKDSRYVSGRSPYWLKMKNPASEAVRHARWAVEGKADRLCLPAPTAATSA
jgi:bifunctional non-homologous end joining protein LigD